MWAAFLLFGAPGGRGTAEHWRTQRGTAILCPRCGLKLGELLANAMVLQLHHGRASLGIAKLIACDRRSCGGIWMAEGAAAFVGLVVVLPDAMPPIVVLPSRERARKRRAAR